MTTFKWTTTFSVLHAGMLVAVYIIDKSRSNWLSGPSFIILGLIALLFHLMLMIASWNISEKKVNPSLISISGILLGLFIILFIRYLTGTS